MSNSTLDLLNQAISSQKSGDSSSSKAMSETFGSGGSLSYEEARNEAEFVSSSNGQADTDSYLDSMLGIEGTKENTESGEKKELSEEQKETKTGEDPSAKAKQEVSPNIEYLTVKGPNGRSQKVKIDYSDKDSIKKAYSMAAGARKWQVERDALANEVKSLQETSGKKAENFDLLDKIYQKNGIEGVVDFLSHDQGGFDKFIEKKIKEREWRASATPEEVALHDARQAQTLKDRELEQLKKEMNEIREQNVQARDESELRSLESQIHPAFDKYRFSGKLGSPQEEHMLDKMLWNTAMTNLEEYPDDTDITPEVIQKEFSAVSQSIRKLINKQVDTAVTKTVDQKKKNAMEQAQMQTLKGYSGNQNAQEMKQLLRNPNTNNLTQLLTKVLKRG